MRATTLMAALLVGAAGCSSRDTKDAGDPADTDGIDTNTDPTGNGNGNGNGNSGSFDPDDVTVDPSVCSFTVPGNAVVITDDASITEDGVVALVCGGATLSVSGDDGTFYVDNDGDIVLNSTGNEVYLSGSGQIALFQDPNTVYFHQDGQVNDESPNGNDLIRCADVLLSQGC